MVRFRLVFHLALGALVLLGCWAIMQAPPAADAPVGGERTFAPAAAADAPSLPAIWPKISEAEELEYARRDEEQADGLLKPSLDLLAPGNIKAGRKRLQAIVDKYPDTQAAARARQYLAP